MIRALLALACLSPMLAGAHHSVVAAFDGERHIELTGEVVSVSWRNPHVSFVLRSVADAALWSVESQSVSTLRRMNVTAALVGEGDVIRVYGSPARSGGNSMWADNVLLASGQELVMRQGVAPRWASEALGTTGPGFSAAGDVSDPGAGIFKVWSTTFSIPMLFPENVDAGFDFDRYPLTPAARAALESFDAAVDAPTRNCTPKGMPTIMEQPFPMQFSMQESGDIVLRIEEYDTVRTIHMDGAPPADSVTASPLGVSTGRWEGSGLVVTTTRIDWPHFDTVGIPLGDAAEIVEVFTPSADGSRLDYRITVTDPDTFTRPVTLEKYWLWLPDVEVQRYDCTVGPGG